ncbi:MAG: ABC transporter permease [Nitrospiraceae bacterium]
MMSPEKTGAFSTMAIRNLVKHRSLIWQLMKREVLGRYRNSILGVVWSLAHPLMMLTVYTLVFRFVFKVRWSADENQNSIDFALALFTGLIAHSLFSECISRAPNLIVNNVNYVKKVVFPLEVLPLVSLAASLFQMGVNLMVLLLFYAVSHHSLNWTATMFPLLVIPMALVVLGASWFLASVGVFVRDVGHATGVVSSLMLFLSPVFYPVSALPEAYRPLLYLNPLTFIIEQARDVLIAGKLPSWYGLGVYFLCSGVVAWLGLAWFERTRKGFADVL